MDRTSDLEQHGALGELDGFQVRAQSGKVRHRERVQKEIGGVRHGALLPKRRERGSVSQPLTPDCAVPVMSQNIAIDLSGSQHSGKAYLADRHPTTATLSQRNRAITGEGSPIPEV